MTTTKTAAEAAKTAEDIFSEMIAIMPFALNERCMPYIIEAMKVYARQSVVHHLQQAAIKAKITWTPVGGVPLRVLEYGAANGDRFQADQQSIIDTQIELK